MNFKNSFEVTPKQVRKQQKMCGHNARARQIHRVWSYLSNKLHKTPINPSPPQKKKYGASKSKRKIVTPESVEKTVDKLEFTLERQQLNEMLEINFNRKTFREGRNHKKLHSNHRDVLTMRTVEYSLE